MTGFGGLDVYGGWTHEGLSPGVLGLCSLVKPLVKRAGFKDCLSERSEESLVGLIKGRIRNDTGVVPYGVLFVVFLSGARNLWWG